MKKKILIVSIFATLLMFSMPFISTIQARSADPATANTKSPAITRASPEELVTEAQNTIALLQFYSADPEISTICAEAATALTTGVSSINWCWLWDKLLDGLVIAMGLAIANGEFDKLFNVLLPEFRLLSSLYELLCGSYQFFGMGSALAGVSGDVSAPADECHLCGGLQ